MLCNPAWAAGVSTCADLMCDEVRLLHIRQHLKTDSRIVIFGAAAFGLAFGQYLSGFLEMAAPDACINGQTLEYIALGVTAAGQLHF